MSFMMTGYIIFALLVLVLVNIALRVSSKKKGGTCETTRNEPLDGR
ncbi:hypothetical protein RWE15_04900 [Virgibacillus halophilus]|uniref:Tumour necrosis factor receptor superfamily member 19 n=1 Tax=Tigheibacillus halophilus TaxID=361280 RepID=A0ABU5C5F3_9BACI|nr:hypothetical protein [Virgibacillus halophilus]